mgnify:CR=1 FL=1
MKKIINQPADFVDETIEGILAAYGDRVKIHNGDKRIYLSNYPARDGKVGIVTGGGSGHLPVFLGYVGKGLLDGCAVGNVFASPSAQKMADMIAVPPGAKPASPIPITVRAKKSCVKFLVMPHRAVATLHSTAMIPIAFRLLHRSIRTEKGREKIRMAQ